ncbi:hypothetical protein J6590_033457 [Homalodisca vitripennis]|nr:hypothetical protein J6590_033457 [Homalodisca vitripennis]
MSVAIVNRRITRNRRRVRISNLGIKTPCNDCVRSAWHAVGVERARARVCAADRASCVLFALDKAVLTHLTIDPNLKCILEEIS